MFEKKICLAMEDLSIKFTAFANFVSIFLSYMLEAQFLYLNQMLDD